MNVVVTSRAFLVPIIATVSALALVLGAASLASPFGVGFPTDAAFCATRGITRAVGEVGVGIVFVACLAVFALSVGLAAFIAQRLAMRAQLGRGAVLVGAVAAAVVLCTPWFVRATLGGIAGALGAATVALVIGVGAGSSAMIVPRHARGRMVVAGLAATCVVLLAWRAVPRYRADSRAYAKERARVHVHGRKLGTYVRDNLPSARVLAGDACTIATYAERPVISVDPPTPAERFEWLERTASRDERPTHVIAPPGWLGGPDVVGALLSDGWFARAQVLISEIDWDHMGTGERPLTLREGWSVVDRVDIADRESEAAHAWTANARGAAVARDVTHGLMLDGGRTIDGDATFIVARTPGLLAQLILRTGGPARADARDVVRTPAQLRIEVDGENVGTIDVPAPTGPFVELAITLPGGTPRDSSTIRVRASGPYRAFHWFAVTP